ncbi:MAG: SDR family oxidoreductase [Nanoarchaeota archaeon]
MSRYVVTGGAGFIGSHIVEELIKLGQEVVVLDDFSTGKEENIAEWKDQITLIKGDIRDFETVKKALQGADYVLHQAGKNSVPFSWKNPQLFSEVNITGTLNILEAAYMEKVKRVVFAGSSSIYGSVQKIPQQEDDGFSPLSPYAVTKHASIQNLRIYYETHGLETISLIYFNVFGPRQDPNSEYSAVIPRFIKMIKKNEVPTIYGDGEQSRDFTYVKNVVEGNLLACKAKHASGQAINLANGEGCTVNQMFQKINQLLGKHIKPAYAPSRAGEVRNSLADPTKAKKLLGYTGKYSFDEGLKLTVEWFKNKF